MLNGSEVGVFPGLFSPGWGEAAQKFGLEEAESTIV